MRIRLLIVPVVFLFFPIISFADIVIKIDNFTLTTKFADSEKTLNFSKPGNQKVIIKNYSDNAIDVGDFYFIGDEFTAPLILDGFEFKKAQNSIIKAGNSRAMVVIAGQNAAPSVNPVGHPVILSYKVVGVKDDRLIQFKLKSTYNDDIRFYNRNIELSRENSFEDEECTEDSSGTIGCYEGDDLCSRSGDLTIINNSTGQVYIKDINIIKNGKSVGKVKYNSCHGSLEAGKSCKVGLAVDCKLKEDADVLPIWVTYDKVSSSGVKKEGLKAVAAAVINSNLKPDEMQVGRAALSGYIMAKTVGAVYDDSVINYVKSILFVQLGDGNINSLKSTALSGSLMGVGYAADGHADDLMGYRGGEVTNWIFGVSLQYFLALMTCAKKTGVEGWVCIAMSTLCGLTASLITGYIQSAVHSNVVHHLPEQKSSHRTYWDDSKLIFNFGMSAIIRNACKSMNDVPNAGWVEALGESISAWIIPYAYEGISFVGGSVKNLIYGKDRHMPTFSTNDTFVIDNNCGEECVSSKLKEFESDEL